VSRSETRRAGAAWTAFFTTWVTIVGLTVASPARAETSYWRLTADRVTVLSTGSAKRCEHIAFQVLRFEQFFRELSGWNPEDEFRPIAVYAMANGDAQTVMFNEEDRRKQTSQWSIYSKFLPGLDFNAVALIERSGDDMPLQSVLLMYAQDLIQTGPARQNPIWFQIGVPNLLNGVVIRDDGTVWLNRNTLFEPVVDKKNQGHVAYDVPQLLSASASGVSDWREYSKRAQVWAQFGLLTGPERRKQFQELALLMRQGTPAEEAVSQAFGASLADVTAQFNDGAWRKQATFKFPPTTTPIAVPNAEKVDASEVKRLLQVIAARVGKEPGPIE
jgi:hypothetical protein